MQLWQITAHHFVCGVMVERNRVIKAAPIAYWMLGRHWDGLQRYLHDKRGYDTEAVEALPPGAMAPR